MQNKLAAGIMGALLVVGMALVGWQAWTTNALRQQVAALQQQLAGQSRSPNSAHLAPSGSPPLATAPVQPQSPSGGPGNSPFGNDDPFAEMQRMQEDMHERMQRMLEGFGMDLPLFDMDPFQGGSGFSSSMGFGVQPDFSFTEEADAYVVTVKIPEGSNVEITTDVRGQELTLQGKVTVQDQDRNNSGAFSSVQTQQFARTLTLPGDVDVLGITNETVGDEIRITLPKQKGGNGL